ncbi:MAG: beta strand repeat-containing protein, partial [Gammaproteobacteria bacterium]
PGLSQLSTSQLQQQSTYTGWDFTNTWGILENTSYPYLTSIYTSTPRVISGSANTPYGTDGIITLTANGSVLPDSKLTINSVGTGFDGQFYFLEGNGVISDGSVIFAYEHENQALSFAPGNLIDFAPAQGGSLTGELFSSNLINVGGNNEGTFSNTSLGTAIAHLTNNSNILYSVSGSTLYLGNASYDPTFVTDPNTSNITYTLDGDIKPAPNTGVLGAITFNGPVVLTTDVTLSANNIKFNNGVTSVSGAGRNLTLETTDVDGSGSSFDFAPSDVTLNNLTMENTIVGNGNTRNLFNFEPYGNVTLNSLTMKNTSDGNQNNFAVSTRTFATIHQITLTDSSTTSLDVFVVHDLDLITANSVAITGSGNTLHNTLIAATSDPTIATTWHINTANGGTGTGYSGIGSFTFANIGNLDIQQFSRIGVVSGGGQALNSQPRADPDFIFTDGGSLNSIAGNPSAVNVLDFSQYSTPLNIVLNGLSISTGTGPQFALNTTVGGSNNGVAPGFNGTANAGVNFFANITSIIGNPTLSNTLTGFGGANGSPPLNNVWTITGLNSGHLVSSLPSLPEDLGNPIGIVPFQAEQSRTSQPNTLSFTNFQNLVGGTINNNGDGAAFIGNTGGFLGGPGVVGGSLVNSDTFILSGGTLSGSITGGTGTNTLVADNVANNFQITGENSGKVTGVAGGFSNIQNLTGGTSNNTFTFMPNGVIDGTIDGGNTTATNTLDYVQSGFPVAVLLQDSTSGIVLSSDDSLLTTFSNINKINSQEGGFILLPSDSVVVHITGADQGTLAPLAFNGFSTITGSQNSRVNFDVPATQIQQLTVIPTFVGFADGVDPSGIGPQINGVVSNPNGSLPNQIARPFEFQVDAFTVNGKVMIFDNIDNFTGSLTTGATQALNDQTVIIPITFDFAAVNNAVVTSVTPYGTPNYFSPSIQQQAMQAFGVLVEFSQELQDLLTQEISSNNLSTQVTYQYTE